MKPINFESMAVAHYMTDDTETFAGMEDEDNSVADIFSASRSDLVEEAQGLARTLFRAYLIGRDEEEVFNTTYPPDDSLPASTEFDVEDGYYGYYDDSEEDLAIVRNSNPLCVWSFADGPGGFTAYSGMQPRRFVTNYYVSNVPRAGEHAEYYLLRPDEENV